MYTCSNASAVLILALFTSYRCQHNDVFNEGTDYPHTGEDLRFINVICLCFSPCVFQATGPHVEWRLTGFIVPCGQHQIGK